MWTCLEFTLQTIKKKLIRDAQKICSHSGWCSLFLDGTNTNRILFSLQYLVFEECLQIGFSRYLLLSPWVLL